MQSALLAILVSGVMMVSKNEVQQNAVLDLHHHSKDADAPCRALPSIYRYRGKTGPSQARVPSLLQRELSQLRAKSCHLLHQLCCLGRGDFCPGGVQNLLAWKVGRKQIDVAKRKPDPLERTVNVRLGKRNKEQRPGP